LGCSCSEEAFLLHLVGRSIDRHICLERKGPVRGT
jgi:hypothetical protein